MALERRTPLGPGRKATERGTSFAARQTPLKRTTPKPGARSTLKHGKGFSASPAQRAKVAVQSCAVCQFDHCDPAHVISRAMGGDDDPRAVVALCRRCHDDYDNGRISLLEHLEPLYREELAYAVALVGLITAIERITNERWMPVASQENL